MKNVKRENHLTMNLENEYDKKERKEHYE
jgi:hypothetical protein